MKSSRLNETASGLIVPLAILLAWQALAWRAATPLFPGPWQVALSIWKLYPMIVGQIGYTLMRALAGFVVAAVLMIPLGILLGRLKTVGRLVEPMMDMLATLPPPAVVPIVMLFAGTGDIAKIVIIAYAAAVPLIMNTYEASKTLHLMANQVARSLRLSRFETMLHIDLPASLPMIATGMRLAIASALLVSVTSEMLLATNGIGVVIQRQQENFQIAGGLAAIAFISVIGLIINSLVFQLEKRWLFWHYRSSESHNDG
ncbi:ABC transporter permease [Mesorhizobium sp. INR15]|uniref:ABC transporter permease n=1 Tax=Mesorhizobium sp. INR15 TaxID=2654248 RepID=UPI0018963E8D|nr:ABC transporter permease [Mesorhizobium sp. INR15]QPC94323.1 ABC transporter permease subunit [Mesorhizobium sp. INR15]